MFQKLILSLFLITFPLYAQSISVHGFVTDKKSGETLIGVTITVESNKRIGTTTNKFGYFSLTMPNGNQQLIFSTIGYHKQSIPINSSEDMKLNIALEEDILNLDEVVITSSEERERIAQPLTGVEQLRVSAINKLPVLFGERDILKTIQLLPGVKSNGDGQTGFTVRGGNLDHNLILLDDAPVYNASHLLGFFSTFNSDAIKDVMFYKGTAPAQYGGRISSVVDVTMNEGNNRNYNVSGGIGLISSKLNIEGPLQEGTSSFLITGRRTYADVFLSLSDKFKDNKLYFYDLNTKFNFSFSENDRLFVSGYFGRDVLGMNSRFEIDWGNQTATVRWNHLFNSQWFSNTSLIFSSYDYNISIQNNANPFSILSKITDWNLKQEFQHFPSEEQKWLFGYNIIYHQITPGQLTDNTSTSNPYQLRDGLESALYTSKDWAFSERLMFNAGIRFSDFIVLGGSDYYVLDEKKNIVDTLQQGNPVEHYFAIEPRLTLSYLLDENTSLKSSYTRNSQNMHLVTNSFTTNPTDKWVMNTNNIKPETGDQLTLGYFRNFDEDTYEVSAETYFKWMNNQLDYKDNADERHSVIETQLLFGDGRAYGLELLLKKKKGRLTGWFGYTLARSEKLIDGINGNTWYPSRQDRTHDFSIAAMYELSPIWNLSATWVYQTGNAVTFPSGKYFVAGQTTWLYTERNGYRMPDYHRLDLGVTAKLYENSEFVFSLYNAYGRENPYIITFEESEDDPNKTVAVQTALFKWIPSLSWNYKF